MSATGGFAQESGCPSGIGRPGAMGRVADPVRVAELRAAAAAPPGDPLRTGSRHLLASWCAAGPTAGGGQGVSLLPVVTTFDYRSAYPSDLNNGLLWSGRGIGTGLAGGMRAGWGPVDLVLAPVAAWQENRGVEIAPGAGPFRYPYHTMDWPQRFGGGSFISLHPGQSALHVGLGPVGLRLASENLWWGPAHRYPILLSNTGPGFAQVALSPERPVWVGLGHLSGRLLWGRLDESDYFDEEPANDHRLLSGVFVELQPWILPGLTLGAGLLYHLPWEDVTGNLFRVFTFAVSEEEGSTGNGLASVTARWVHPASGFEAYGEWAREDFWLNTEDLLTELDHSMGHMIGASKLQDLGGGSELLVEVEWTSLETHSEHRSEQRIRPRFYAHSTVEQGHTHRGHLLGSAIGPGSDAQFLAATHQGGGRSLGLFVERVRRDADAYFQHKVDTYGFRGHDVEWTVGAHGSELLRRVGLRWTTSLSRRKNRNFIGLDGRSWDFLRETNASVVVRAWWLR